MGRARWRATLVVAAVAALVVVAAVVALLLHRPPVVLVGTHTWLADAPVGERGGAAAVWTGAEYLVVGGDTAATDGITLSDGAMSAAESMTVGPNGEVVEDPSVRADAYALDPADGAWRRLADAPFPVHQAAAVWTGEEVVVVDWDRAAAYSPTTDTWRRLPDLERGVGPWPVTAAVDGLVVLTDDSGLGPGDLLVIDPATGATATLAGGHAVFDLQVVGDDLVVVRDQHDGAGDEVTHTWIVDRVPVPALRGALDGPRADAADLDQVAARVAQVPGSATGDGAHLVVEQERWLLLVATEERERILRVHDVTPGTPAGRAAAPIADFAWEGRLPGGPFERGPLLQHGDWVLGAWSPFEAWRLGDDGVEVGRVDEAHVDGQWPELTADHTVAGGPVGVVLVVMGGGPPVLIDWSEPGEGTVRQ